MFRSLPIAGVLSPEGQEALDDQEIVRRLQCRDASGVDALLHQYGPVVKSLLRKSFAYVDEHELETALHDGAMIMWKKEVAGRLDPKRSVRSFYYVTCRRELMRAWGKKPAEQSWDPAVVDATQAVQQKAEEQSGGPALSEIMSGLSPLERGILAADIASNFSVSSAELATQLDSTPGSVDSLRSRIRKKLRKWLVGTGGRS